MRQEWGLFQALSIAEFEPRTSKCQTTWEYAHQPLDHHPWWFKSCTAGPIVRLPFLPTSTHPIPLAIANEILVKDNLFDQKNRSKENILSNLFCVNYVGGKKNHLLVRAKSQPIFLIKCEVSNIEFNPLI